MSSTVADALARAEILLAAVEALVATHEHCAESPWLGEIFGAWRRHGLDAEHARPFAELVAALSDPIGGRMTIASYGVTASDDAHTQADLIAAVERAAAGQRPLGSCRSESPTCAPPSPASASSAGPLLTRRSGAKSRKSSSGEAMLPAPSRAGARWRPSFSSGNAGSPRRSRPRASIRPGSSGKRRRVGPPADPMGSGGNREPLSGRAERCRDRRRLAHAAAPRKPFGPSYPVTAWAVPAPNLRRRRKNWRILAQGVFPGRSLNFCRRRSAIPRDRRAPSPISGRCSLPSLGASGASAQILILVERVAAAIAELWGARIRRHFLCTRQVEGIQK